MSKVELLPFKFLKSIGEASLFCRSARLFEHIQDVAKPNYSQNGMSVAISPLDELSQCLKVQLAMEQNINQSCSPGMPCSCAALSAEALRSFLGLLTSP